MELLHVEQVKQKAQASANVNTDFETITNQKYITSEVTDSGNAQANISAFNAQLEQRNQAEVAAHTDANGKYTGVHGMSEKEYDEYQAWMYYAYGVEVENLSVGNFQSAAVSMERAIGRQYADEMAQSYDSVLDLVLDEKLNQAINDIFGEGTMPNWARLYNCKDRLFKEYGILIDCLTPDELHKTFSVSMVDENGNVIQDENGKLAQTIKNDCLMPDGLAQRNEIFNSSVLDMMGYDCYSALDLTAQEYEMIKEMAKMDSSDLGSSSSYKGDNGHGLRNKIRDELRQKNGVDKNGDIIKTDFSDWKNGTYVDEFSGETTGRKKYWNEFKAQRESGYFKTRINDVTGHSANWANKSITRNIYANYEATGEFANGKIEGKAGAPGAYDFGKEKSSSGDMTAQGQEVSLNGEAQTQDATAQAENKKQSGKVKISKKDFDRMVEDTMEDKKVTESEAEKIVLEKYEVK